MYNERNENFSGRDLILQVLFVILFVFILLWLFPTKSYVDKKIDPLYDKTTTVYIDNFNDNVKNMKEAAIAYFTNSRLPKEVGSTERITLATMFQQKLLLSFNDKNGNQCDLHNSYVEVTKMQDEYVMKVNLKCGEVADYVVVHLGCYDYCKDDVCEKEDTKPVVNKPVVNKPNPTTPKPTTPKPTDPKPVDPKPVDPKPETPKTTYYKYEKVVPDKWVLDKDWTNKFYSNSDTLRLKYRKTYIMNTSKTESHVYRTVAWITNQSSHSYTLNIENIPRDAENIRVTDIYKISTSSELNRYIRNRFNGDISMVGANPSYNESSPNHSIENMVTNYSYNYSLNARRNQITLNYNSISTLGVKPNVNNRYFVGLVFEISWTIPGETTTYEYQYERLEKGSSDVKISTSANDKDLLNEGYKYVGVSHQA